MRISRRINPYEQEFLKFLRNDDILIVRRSAQLKFLRKKFLDLESVSNRIITQLYEFSEESPQSIIDFSKNILSKDIRFFFL